MIDPRTLGIVKFGRNPDLDSAAAEDVWSQGGLYTFLSSAATLYVSSSSGSDTSKDVTVIGLDASGTEVTRIATLNGQNQVALSGTWLRVYRAYNGGASAFAGNVYVAESDTLTGGVPNTASKIKAKIDVAEGQTLMAITTIPAIVGTRTVRTAYIANVWVNALAATPAATKIDFDLLVRTSGGAWRTQSSFGLNTSNQSLVARPFARYIEVAPLTDIRMRAASSADNADVTVEFDVFYEV